VSNQAAHRRCCFGINWTVRALYRQAAVGNPDRVVLLCDRARPNPGPERSSAAERNANRISVADTQIWVIWNGQRTRLSVNIYFSF
jgi:hypothetical protein